MSKLRKWVGKIAQDLVDPDRETRLAELVNGMHRGLQEQGPKFSLSSFAQGKDINDRDLAAARDQLYRKLLAKGWLDGKLTEEERQVATWVAKSLEFPEPDARAINIEFARERFSVALAEAMEDGVLDEQEEAQLEAIAASVGMRLADFTRAFFKVTGERFLRAIFMACVAGGNIAEGEWEYLLQVTKKFGIERAELLKVIQPQAEQFIEHVLADAKADGRLSPDEHATLDWLVRNLGISPGFRKYLANEVSLLKSLTDIADGRLPSISPPQGVQVRAGEIVHFSTRATWREVRQLKSGPKITDHPGVMTLTDNRLIFSSPSKSQNITYRRLVSHSGGNDAIEIQVSSKPSATFFLAESSSVPYAVFRSAVAMANQTLTAKADAPITRNIPRDVRQRVWQRYGGRCADCGATDYLEFDHVIPHAKGGSNSDNNIQLLCRRCNLKKSDHI